MNPNSIYPDQNSRKLGMGWCPFIGVLPFSINPLNNKLKIEIIPRSIGTLNVRQGAVPIDANSREAGAGLTLDSNLTLTPLSTDSVGSPTPINLLRVDAINLP